MLPEDLRSSIIKNYGRRLIKEYTEDLLAAVAFWRQTGAWRSKLRKKAVTVPSAPAVVPGARDGRSVIALAERRRTPMGRAVPHSDVETEYTLNRPKTAAR